MTTRYRKFEFQLQDRSLGSDLAGPSITTDGGKCIVTGAGTPLKATLYDQDGASLANPITLANGKGTFYTLDTVESVDMFIQTPDGQSVQLWSVKADALQLVPVNRGVAQQTMIVPFHVTNFPANTETDTGFDITTTMVMSPNIALQVTTIDTGITIDVGTDGSGANDPNGLIEAGVLDTAAVVVPKVTNAAKTLGALLYVQDSANAGDEAPSAFCETTSENLTITLAASADTAAGYVILPYTNVTRSQPTI